MEENKENLLPSGLTLAVLLTYIQLAGDSFNKKKVKEVCVGEAAHIDKLELKMLID